MLTSIDQINVTSVMVMISMSRSHLSVAIATVTSIGGFVTRKDIMDVFREM
jgi:hypothetical protein